MKVDKKRRDSSIASRSVITQGPVSAGPGSRDTRSADKRNRDGAAAGLAREETDSGG